MKSFDIEKLTSDEIITIINEMYDFNQNNNNGVSPKLLELHTKYPHVLSHDMLYQYVLAEATNRFDKLVVELLAKHPSRYINLK